MSQLGIMMIAIGLSAYNLSLFHLFCHSFFKALLFMSAGSIIHSVVSEYQDIRMYGGMLKFLPLTYVCLLIASLSLMAIPGLTGYYSKDIIIESGLGVYSISGYVIYWLALTSAVLTSLYSIRVLYLTFFNVPNGPKHTYINIHEADYVLVIPMVILSIASIFAGYFARDIYLGMGRIIRGVLIHPSNLSLIETEFGINVVLKLLPLIFVILGGVLVLVIYEFNYKFFYLFNNKFLKSVYYYLNQKMMFDQILNNLVIRGGLKVSGDLSKNVDKGILQILGPIGIGNLLENMFLYIVRLSDGMFASYALIFLGFIVLVFFIDIFSILFPVLLGGLIVSIAVF